MNTGQMLITIGAMFLLSTVILTVNRGSLSTQTVMIDNRYGIMAVSLATSMIESATNKSFDENSDTLGLTSTNQLTLKNNLGLDAGELISSPGSFDDFDDYNCYKAVAKADTIPIVDGLEERELIFNTFCEVDYVAANNPENTSALRTWHKRMRVRVFSPGLQDTIKMSTVYSYFFFR